MGGVGPMQGESVLQHAVADALELIYDINADL